LEALVGGLALMAPAGSGMRVSGGAEQAGEKWNYHVSL
jgi:hypothetical protein